ncbi:MBL fold metallo-hydrolase RNA specificity domain-containing protein [Staphylococcus aureus]
MMINIMKPEYFIPVQGEFKMQIAHAKLSSQAGVAPKYFPCGKRRCH